MSTSDTDDVLSREVGLPLVLSVVASWQVDEISIFVRHPHDVEEVTCTSSDFRVRLEEHIDDVLSGSVLRGVSGTSVWCLTVSGRSLIERLDSDVRRVRRTSEVHDGKIVDGEWLLNQERWAWRDPSRRR